MRSLYLIPAEVKNTPEAEMDDEMGGAAVNIYVTAGSADEALSRARATLEKDNYIVYRFESAIACHPEEFDEDRDPAEQEAMRNAAETDGVYYGVFFCWDADAPDAV